MKRIVSLLGIAAALALGMADARAQVQREVPSFGPPVLVPVQFPDSLQIQVVSGDCLIVLAAPVGTERQLPRFLLSYTRSEGCRWWPLDRELLSLSTALRVLMEDVPDRARVIGLTFGRVAQPALRLRIANAALSRDMTMMLDGREFRRQLQAALVEDRVFREIEELFAGYGIELTLAGIDSIERRREVELGEMAVDPSELSRQPPVGARIPVGAFVTFDAKVK